MQMIVSNEREQRQQWLNGLKVGDSVAIPLGGWGRKDWAIKKIEKITPTRRMVIGSTTFDSSGREMGKKDGWSSRSNIYPVTNEVKETIARNNALYHINNLRFETLTTQQLLDVLKIINPDVSK